MSDFEIVAIPTIRKAGGEFGAVLDEVSRLTDGKCVKLPRLSAIKSNTLRMAARQRGLSLAIRNTPDATYVWRKAAQTRIHGVA